MRTFCGIDNPRSDKYRLEILFVNVTSGLAANNFVMAPQATRRTAVSPTVSTCSRISVQSFTKL